MSTNMLEECSAFGKVKSDQIDKAIRVTTNCQPFADTEPLKPADHSGSLIASKCGKSP